MAAVNEMKRLEMSYPGESTAATDRMKELNLTKFDIRAQSVPLEGTDGVRASSIRPANDGILDTFFDGVTTLYTAFQRGLNISRNANCLGWRIPGNESYDWLTYEEVHKRARAFGSGMLKHGIAVGQDTRLGIFSKNCVEWVLAEQAASMFSMVVVPFYDSLSPGACRYICNSTEMEVIVCYSERNASPIVEAPETSSTLKTIIIVEEASKAFIEKASEKGITILQFKDVEAAGSEDLQEPVPPKPDDVCTICFTSGTTGNPKGVVLTHYNLINAVNGSVAIFSERIEIRTGDVLISYLPLAHIYERYFQVLLFMHGASIGFFSGDPKLLLQDMGCLKPTIFPCVPRVMNKLFDKISGSVSEKNKVKQMIFKKAFSVKKKEVLSGTIRNNGFWDFAFKPIRNLHGGRIRLITTGAAPISAEIKIWFRIIFGCMVLEGYGQTETSGPITISHPNDLSDGHVGMVFPTTHIKLIDAPELEYFSKKGQGEICVKGTTIFKGYYKDPEKTNETLDKDGFVHTGDIGEWLPNGQLKIIDRVKHIFKLSQGEYVAPERVENEYIKTEGVAQIFVYGESLEDYCIAIVVPDEEWVTKEAKQRQWEGEFKTICGKQELHDLLLEKMNKLAGKSDLKGFERVKQIHIHSDLFSVENDFLTPTFKSKRPNLKKYFKDTFNEMYNELREQKKGPGGQTMTNGASTSSKNESAAAEKEVKKGDAGEEKNIDGGEKKETETDEKKGAEEGEKKEAEEGEKKEAEKDDNKGAEEDEKKGAEENEKKGAEVEETKVDEEDEKKEAEEDEKKETEGEEPKVVEEDKKTVAEEDEKKGADE